MPSKAELISELNGQDCRCGNKKAHGHTFCGGCFHSLSKPQQIHLYRRMGQGYEAAYAEAVKTLGPVLEGA